MEQLTKDQPTYKLVCGDNGEVHTLYVKSVPASKGRALQLVNNKSGEPEYGQFQLADKGSFFLRFVGLVTIEEDVVYELKILPAETGLRIGQVITYSKL